MSLLITNENLISNINFGSKYPFVNVDGFYYILYKTTCLVNNKIYIGIHSSKKLQSTYIGCGINSKNINKGIYGFSQFKRAVEKYGYKKFKRENLLFFSSREDALRAERIIVTKEFITNKQVMNCCIGGGAPPRKIGCENGNFNKKWSLEQKKRASDYFKQNRKTQGANNSNAKKCWLLDIRNNTIMKFDCFQQAENFLQLKTGSFRALTNKNKYHIFKKYYFFSEILITKESINLIYQEIKKGLSKYKANIHVKNS